MGVHSRSHFEICLHKNLFMAEKVHEIFPPTVLSLGFVLWFLHWFYQMSSYSCLGLSFSSLLPHMQSHHPDPLSLPREMATTWQEAQAVWKHHSLGLVFADLTFPSGCAFIVHFAYGHTWIAQIQRAGVQKQTPKLLTKLAMHQTSPPAWPLDDLGAHSKTSWR